MKTNKEKFIESYARRLKTHWAANCYEEPMLESFEERAERAIEAFLSFGSEPGVIMWATMKEYDLALNFDSLRNYLLSNET